MCRPHASRPSGESGLECRAGVSSVEGDGAGRLYAGVGCGIGLTAGRRRATGGLRLRGAAVVHSRQQRVPARPGLGQLGADVREAPRWAGDKWRGSGTARRRLGTGSRPRSVRSLLRRESRPARKLGAIPEPSGSSRRWDCRPARRKAAPRPRLDAIRRRTFKDGYRTQHHAAMRSQS